MIKNNAFILIEYLFACDAALAIVWTIWNKLNLIQVFGYSAGVFKFNADVLSKSVRVIKYTIHF